MDAEGRVTQEQLPSGRLGGGELVQKPKEVMSKARRKNEWQLPI